MAEMEKKNFDQPDDVRVFKGKGQAEVGEVVGELRGAAPGSRSGLQEALQVLGQTHRVMGRWGDNAVMRGVSVKGVNWCTR